MNWWWLSAEVDGARREVGQLRDELRRQQQRANGPFEHRPGMLRLVLIGSLVFLESLALALLTWVYTGSSKGLSVPLPDGTPVGGLHWDPALALLASIAVFLFWAVGAFMIPVLGPMLNFTVSALWGGIVFAFGESIGFGVLMFGVSFIGRTAYRAYRSRTMAIVEWSAVAVLAAFGLAPFGADAAGFGLGGWHKLRDVRDGHQCKRELRTAHYDRLCTLIKARDRGRCERDLGSGATYFNEDHPAVRAQIRSCQKERARARLP